LVTPDLWCFSTVQSWYFFRHQHFLFISSMYAVICQFFGGICHLSLLVSRLKTFTVIFATDCYYPPDCVHRLVALHRISFAHRLFLMNCIVFYACCVSRHQHCCIFMLKLICCICCTCLWHSITWLCRTSADVAANFSKFV